MKCPSPDEQLKLELGELTVNRAREVERHLQECASCVTRRSEQLELGATLRHSPTLKLTDEEFVTRVLNQCDATAQPARGQARTTWLRSLAAGVSAVAAGLALFWFSPPAQRNPETWTARGVHRQGLDAVAVEVLRLRDNNLSPLGNAGLRPGDGITVRVTNAVSTPVYLLIFALDQGGDVHWIYPAYLELASNPSSVVVEANTYGRLLDDAVEPERPATGTLRVVAIVSSQTMTVKEVESRLRDAPSELAPLFPLARVKEWTSKWNEK